MKQVLREGTPLLWHQYLNFASLYFRISQKHGKLHRQFITDKMTQRVKSKSWSSWEWQVITGTLRIVLELTNSFQQPQHDSVHLGTRLARIANELHCFQHRATASWSKLPTDIHAGSVANNTSKNYWQNQHATETVVPHAQMLITLHKVLPILITILLWQDTYLPRNANMEPFQSRLRRTVYQHWVKLAVSPSHCTDQQTRHW